MSTRDDLDEARAMLELLLDADSEVTARVVGYISDIYFQRALKAPREVLFKSVIWAADVLNAGSREGLRAATREELFAQLQTNDCPLCFGRGNDFSHGRSSTPVMPPVTA
jgi:hypothetical protein